MTVVVEVPKWEDVIRQRVVEENVISRVIEPALQRPSGRRQQSAKVMVEPAIYVVAKLKEWSQKRYIVRERMKTTSQNFGLEAQGANIN